MSERALARAPEDARAKAILAEGLLCRGLERDDPWALTAAADAFLARLAAQPKDFFTRLHLAAALHRRFPLSDEAVVALHDAQTALLSADVGAARVRLEIHLRETASGLNAHRQQFLPLLRARAAAYQKGGLTPLELADLLTLLAQTGPGGVARARVILDAHVAQHPDVALDTFHRAEILRGLESPETVATLYRAAAAALCESPDAQPLNECQRARWRLEQLDAVTGTDPQEGGRP